MFGFDSILLSMLLNVLIMELTPKPPLPQAPRYGLSDFSIPTATEDRPHPIIFGTQKVAGNVIWFGDYNAAAVTQQVQAGLFSSQTQTIGYEYRVGLWMSICGVTCDELHEIRLGDVIVWSGNQSLSKTDITVVNVNDRWNTADGQQVADGMEGTFLFFNHRVKDGEEYIPLQNPYMESILGEGNVPAYPNTLHAVWLGPTALTPSLQSLLPQNLNTSSGAFGMVSTNPSIQPFTFTIKRLPDISDVLIQSGYEEVVATELPAYADVGGDANPAYMQLEMLTSRVPGLGPRMTSSAIELSSFQAAAQRYASEGIGCSYVWEVARPVSDMMADIGLLTNSMMEINAQTGQLRTKFLRQDDAPLAFFDETNLIAITSFTRVSVNQAANKIEVPFNDRANNWASRLAIAKNDSAVKIAGAVIDQRSEFIGVTRESLAQYLATREIAKVSAPLAKVSFTGWLQVGLVLKPGDLISFKHPTLNQTIRMRIASAKFGDYNNALRVEIDAIEDIFRVGYNFNTRTTPIPISVTPPPPTALVEPELILAPYALTADDTDHAMYFGMDPGTGVDTYRIAIQNSASWNDAGSIIYIDNNQEPALKATMGLSMSSLESQPLLSIILTDGAKQQFSMRPRAELFVLAGNEWMQASGWKLEGNTLTATTVTRAIFDTVPQRHEINDTVKILLGFVVIPSRMSTQAAVGATKTDGYSVLSVRAESKGTQGILTVDKSTGSQATLAAAVGIVRSMLPLPPGLVSLEGIPGSLSAVEALVTIPTSTNMTLTWSNRNRLSQTISSWFDEDTAEYEPGSYTAIHLEYQNSDNVWIDSGWTYSEVGDTSAVINTSAIPPKSTLRITIAAAKAIGRGHVVSQPLMMAWQLM